MATSAYFPQTLLAAPTGNKFGQAPPVPTIITNPGSSVATQPMPTIMTNPGSSVSLGYGTTAKAVPTGLSSGLSFQYPQTTQVLPTGLSTPAVPPVYTSSVVESAYPSNLVQASSYPSYATAKYPSYATAPALQSTALPTKPVVLQASAATLGAYPAAFIAAPLPDGLAYEAYVKYDTQRDLNELMGLNHGEEESPDVPDVVPEPPPPEEPKGIVGKIKDEVHHVEEKVAETVHHVEEKVEGAVHAVHDKVAGFFGMIGGLFHKSHKPDETHGPAGKEVGPGSTVEITHEDGTVMRGHLLSHADEDGNHLVQLHTDAPGMVSSFHSSQIAPASIAPVVGAGVEVYYNGAWFPGHVLALPTEGQEPPVYTVRCHEDEEGSVTYADAQSIRPLLSPEEKMVVSGNLSSIQAEQAAADAQVAAINEQNRIAALKAADMAAFQQKMTGAGLGGFHSTFVDHGFDTEASLQDVGDSDLSTMGLKLGHITKFHAAFERGSSYVVHNGELKSSAPGVPYRASKSLDDSSTKFAAWGTTVAGVDQMDGWLKVGNRFLPMVVEGKKVIFQQGFEPAAAPEPEEPPAPQSTLSKVEDKVKGGLHAFAHMLHFE